MNTVKLAFVGDVMLHGKITENCQASQNFRPFADVKEIFDKVDGTVLNLECAYPTDEMGPKQPRVIASPEAIKLIQALKPFAVCLANNHTFDCGKSGFEKLTALLDEMNITYFGAGLNVNSASKPVIKQINNLKFGFIGYVESISTPTHIATDQSCGIVLYNRQKVIDAIESLKAKCDHIIVSMHWGQEHLSFPSPNRIASAKKFIDAGALLVIGHHPHVLQGVEQYKNGLIAHSLGNFITTEIVLDSGYRIPRTQDQLLSCILNVEIGQEGIISFEQIPTQTVSGQVKLIDGPNAMNHIIKANRLIRKPVTNTRYKWEYFNKRIIKASISLIKRRGIFFVRPRHFTLLLKEIKTAITRN